MMVMVCHGLNFVKSNRLICYLSSCLSQKLERLVSVLTMTKGLFGEMVMPDSIVLICPRCQRVPLAPPPTICQGCGAVYQLVEGIGDLAATQVVNEWQARFDELANDQNDRPECSDHHSITTFASTQQGVSKLLGALTAPSQILESGCGSGLFAEPWLKDHQVWGVDFSMPNLFKAKKRGLKAYRGDILSLPFADESFDAVLSIGTAQYIANLNALVRESARVLRPKGKLVLVTLNSKSLIRRCRYALRPDLRSQIQNLYSTDQLAASFDASGLCELRYTYHYFPTGWYSVHTRPSAIADLAGATIAVCGQKGP